MPETNSRREWSMSLFPGSVPLPNELPTVTSRRPDLIPGPGDGDDGYPTPPRTYGP